MHSWLLALRADEDVQLEFRALLGPARQAIGRVDLHEFETSSPAAAAQLLDRLASALGYGVAAVTLEDPSTASGPDGSAASEHALALCLASAPGDLVVTAPVARALAPWFCFVRPRRRPGWRLPVPALALAESPRLCSVCRSAAAMLPATAPFVGRADEVDAVLDAMSAGHPLPYAVVRAAQGMGATRLVQEAARRAFVELHRSALRSDSLDASTLQALLDRGAPRPRWLLLDAPQVERVSLPLDTVRSEGAGLVLVVSPACDTPWCAPTREVELGPLAPSESRALVRALLGAESEDLAVQRIARSSGVPGALVARARAAAACGNLVRDDATGAWHPRNRRLVSLEPRRTREHPTRRTIASLDAPLRRALEVLAALGDGASVAEARGALRVVVGDASRLEALQQQGLVAQVGGTVDLGGALPLDLDTPLVGRLDALRSLGALSRIAEAEDSLDARARDAGARFARAARAALGAGDRAAAVRLLHTARTCAAPDEAPTLDAVSRAIAAELGPLVAITPQPGARPPTLTAPTLESIEAAARSREQSGDLPAARRLRALAGLLRGDASLARRVGDQGATVRDMLLGAIGHARESRIPQAVRAAVAALARARREGDGNGEAATLAMLASIYHALGRHDDAVRLAAPIQGRGR